MEVSRGHSPLIITWDKPERRFRVTQLKELLQLLLQRATSTVSPCTCAYGTGTHMNVWGVLSCLDAACCYGDKL